MTEASYLAVSKDDIALRFGKLPPRTHKGARGRLLVVCGSYDPCGLSMSGAAYFAASAAYRIGAGIVEIFTPRENYPALASLVPEAVFSLYGHDESESAVISRLKEAVKHSTAVVLGCGLGKSEMSKTLVKATLEAVECPLLIDADGLNILSEDESLWNILSKVQRRRTVITPHPGEMSRLGGYPIANILMDPVAVAVEYAKKREIVCLLKDHETVITDGEIVYLNHSGNPGMAKAGMGDLLSGIIGALLSWEVQSGYEDALLCTAIGAYLHGLAGDIAVREINEHALMTSDLLPKIGNAIATASGQY
ncbi:MAG: NAD(P)H-hydrate dehydratase [Clostridia bacterium]|nr:NAD(P)H-hydrate dehydratase [Clostridia bacterium]